MMLEQNVYVDELQLISLGEIKKATLCLALFVGQSNYDKLIRHLHFQEHKYFNTQLSQPEEGR